MPKGTTPRRAVLYRAPRIAVSPPEGTSSAQPRAKRGSETTAVPRIARSYSRGLAARVASPTTRAGTKVNSQWKTGMTAPETTVDSAAA